MKIIVPMAGRGSRLRPHTLTIPKPLIPVAGKPIVQWLVEDIVKVCGKKVDEIAFVIGDFGKEVEESLVKVAEGLGAKGSIYYQDEPLGTAHAILCAKDSLEGNCVVAFADTLFKADFTLDSSRDGIIWVSQIDDPSAFGVVKLNEENIITDFVEKPETFISDLAIIGIYYFNNGEYLRSELQYLLDNNIKDKGEFQLTNALENMKNKGTKFSPGKVEEWLDCGNKDATIYTNERVLEYNGNLINDSVQIINSEVIPPCFIGANTIIKNAKIGPHVSLGSNTVVENSVINKTIIQNDSMITNAKLSNSMIGNHVNFDGKNTQQEVSIGDFSEVK
ncbi:MAG TPA: nucleotidyltransferase [Flavobacteriales bacterium]|jgi:glucose-1-phosphate thymidylyltransferase|nr:nucleotidyltransferase [Flavobacteriales bacterium]HIK62738.1 nucleotidyltransferase [Flavobacteriales bacterium]|tara:strand:- start:3947 stop:4948 length:1002 start_codon:yes stop_codon:yes gene_type:complete